MFSDKPVHCCQIQKCWCTYARYIAACSNWTHLQTLIMMWANSWIDYFSLQCSPCTRCEYFTQSLVLLFLLKHSYMQINSTFTDKKYQGDIAASGQMFCRMAYSVLLICCISVIWPCYIWDNSCAEDNCVFRSHATDSLDIQLHRGGDWRC